MSGRLEQLEERVPALQDLVATPLNYPGWTCDPRLWSGELSTHLNELRIPKTPERGMQRARPDFLLYKLGRLHDLDPTFTQRLHEFVSGDAHMRLVNVSGSGKTRLVFETLFAHWGIYLTPDATMAVNPHGSGDVFQMLQTLRSDSIRDLDSIKESQSRRIRLLIQRDLVSRRLGAVLLARLLILERFLEIVAAAGISDADARSKWLWLQLRPHELVGADIFARVAFQLQLWPREQLLTRLDAAVEHCGTKIEFVALDEAQSLAHRFPRAFGRSPKRPYRPLLFAMIQYIASTLRTARLLISGTEVDLELVEDAVECSSSTRRVTRTFCSLGGFESVHRFQSYLRHFLGDDLSDEICNTVHCWVRGRHRMLTVVAMYTLINGHDKLIEVLDATIAATTGYHRPGSSSTVTVSLGLVVEDETLEESSFAPELRVALYTNVLRRQAALFDHAPEQLVGLGLARFDRDTCTARVDEPVMLLNIARWSSQSSRYSTEGLILRRLRDSSTPIRGCAFADGLAHYLWSCASNGLQLDEFVAFPGETPGWARQRAKFAFTELRRGRRSVTPTTTRPGPLICGADTHDDVLAWFTKSSCPFLVPDTGLGADLVFILSLADGPLVVFVHTDPFPKHRPHRVLKVVPRSPSLYYSQLPDAQTLLNDQLSSFKSTNGGSLRSAVPRTLQVYCFSELYRPSYTYSPPVAILDFEKVLDREEVPELDPECVMST